MSKLPPQVAAMAAMPAAELKTLLTVGQALLKTKTGTKRKSSSAPKPRKPKAPAPKPRKPKAPAAKPRKPKVAAAPSAGPLVAYPSDADAWGPDP